MFKSTEVNIHERTKRKNILQRGKKFSLKINDISKIFIFEICLYYFQKFVLVKFACKVFHNKIIPLK